MAGFGVLPTTEETDIDFDPMPAGDYLGVISKSEEKTGDSGATYINFEISIVEPEKYSKRKVWHRIFTHPAPDWKPAAIAINAGLLNKLFVATGFDPAKPPADSAFLHDIPFVVGVVVVKDSKDPTKLRNEVKAVYPRSAGRAIGPAGGGNAPAKSGEASKPSGAPAW